MPHDVAVGGFIGHALVAEAELGVVRKEALLAGQHQPFAVLLSGVVDGAAEQLPGISVSSVLRILYASVQFDYKQS